MADTDSNILTYILGAVILSFVAAGVFIGIDYFESKSAKAPPVTVAATPEIAPAITKRPLPHIAPKEAYEHDRNDVIKRARIYAYPKINFVTKIPEGFVRPRKNRLIKVEASEPGTLVALYDYFPEQPIDMCLSPCSLNADASEKYRLIGYKYGFARYFGWIDTGIWPAEKVFDMGMGQNWLETFEKQKSCFAENAARLSEDRDAEVCIRTPPVAPQPAPKSGHCRLKFSISKTGYTKDVEVLNCTDDFFKAASVESVRTWYYYPKVENGEFVERHDTRTKMVFKISDEDGNLIPE